MHKLFLIIILSFAIPINAFSSETNKPIYGFELVGKGKLKFMFWNIYESQLSAPKGEYKEGGQFSLNIKYLMSFKGEDIAERSILEIKKQGYNNSKQLSKWKNFMKNIFPDVENGSVLEGVFIDGTTTFYHDDRKIAEITDREFGEKFFDIWLSNKTSQPRLRKKLLGII